MKRNGVQPLLQLIRFSMDQPAVLVAAVAVLRNISIHPLNEAHLVENHCVQLLLDVIRKFSKHGQGTLFCGFFLGCFAVQFAKCTILFLAANLNRTIYDIFCHCVSTLRNISATDANRDNILQYDGVEDVMALLSLPDAPKQLLSEVAAAITVFALSPSLCTRLAEMGVVEQIVALASSDSPDVQGHAAAALGNLVGSRMLSHLAAFCLQFCVFHSCGSAKVYGMLGQRRCLPPAVPPVEQPRLAAHCHMDNLRNLS